MAGFAKPKKTVDRNQLYSIFFKRLICIPAGSHVWINRESCENQERARRCKRVL